MKKELRNKKGITLIALVITIIVLLILAGVSISMISSQDGILNKATTAKETQKNATELERVNLAAQSALIEGEGTIDIADTTGTTKGSLKKALIEEFGSTSSVVTGYTDGKVTIDEKQYSVSARGAVSKVEGQWTLTTDSGDTGLSVGDLITSKKKTTEQFYVIGIDGDTVSLLSKYNLKSDGSEQDTTGASNICEFSSTNYWDPDRNLSYPLANGKYQNLNDKTTYPLGTATSIVTIAEDYGESLDVTGRLMTVEEVVALGGTMAYSSTSSCSAFINTQNYWLGSARSSVDVWFVRGELGILGSSYWDDDVSYGVRPVIEVSISSIE